MHVIHAQFHLFCAFVILVSTHDAHKCTQFRFISEETSNSGLQTPVQKVQPLDSGYTDIDLSNARKTIAKQITESKKTIPHIYSTVECNVEKIFILCKKLKKFGIVVSVNDFIIKAACLAFGRIPMVNSYWSENGPVKLNAINIAVASASPNGLVTRVLNNTNELNVQSISSAVRVSNYQQAALFIVLEHQEHCSGTVLNGMNPEHIYMSLKHKFSCYSVFLTSIYSTS